MEARMSYRIDAAAVQMKQWRGNQPTNGGCIAGDGLPVEVLYPLA
jgi:hypothetical protein